MFKSFTAELGISAMVEVNVTEFGMGMKLRTPDSEDDCYFHLSASELTDLYNLLKANAL